MSKNLTFKLIMDGESKGLVAAAKQSEDVSKKLFETIESEAERLKQTSAETAKEIGKIIPTDLPKKAEQVKGELSELGSELQDVANNANKLSASAKKAGGDIYAALGIKPPTVINDAISDLSKKLENFKKNSKLPAEEITRVTKITEQEIARLKSELSGVDTSANTANTGVDRLSKGMGVAKYAATALAGAMAALGVGLGIRELAQTADTYTNLSARINIATKEGGDFTSAMAGVHQVALMTNSSLDATGSLFTRLNAVGKDMGMTQQQALDLTKTVTQAIQIGGGSAQASEAAVQQFIQAMQGGVLRGEEFNSIMENGFGVAEALARGLGVTTGELRKMAENGELSAERVVKALQGQASEVQKTYDQFPTTITNALQKIATSWQILIGEMDQSNGASATVAKWLSTLADNMYLLKPIIEDIGSGFTRFGEYYSNIYDQGTIDSLKATLLSVYETIKTLFNTVLEVGEAFHDVFSDALSTVLGFTNGLYPAGEQVSGFQKFIDLLNIALGFLNDGFKTIGIGVNLFTGTLYGLASAWYELKSILSWGEVKEKAIADMEAMRAKSDEYFTKGFDGAKNFESKTIETIQNIGKTDKEKNQERIADNQQTLEQLKAQEEKHKTNYKSISDERIQAEQQLFEARKSGNQSAIDLAVKGLAALDAKEKAYQAESQKITEAKIQAAQNWVDAQLMAADGTQKAVDLATQKTLQTTLAAQGLKAEFSTTGGVIVTAMDQAAVGVTNLDNKLVMGRKGAEALGLDLDVALNRVSEAFGSKKKSLDDFVNGLELMGVRGKQAGEVTYQAWLKWLETAKSQAEIDEAKAKLKEFGTSGQLSTQQVEMGMQAVKRAVQEIPDSLSPVEAAMERLGIKSKEQLKLAAENALTDLDTVMKSGEATQEGLQKAYEETVRLAQASGNAQVMAAANAKAAYLGLEVQLDATGKATVTKLGEIQQAAIETQRTVSQVSQSTTQEQPEISAEQQATNDYWDDFKAKMKARTDELNAKSQARGTGGGNASLLSNGRDSTQQISAVPDAPLIATSLDIQPIEGMETKQSVEIKIDMGTGQTSTVSAAPDQATALEEMMRELEAIKGRS
ncbi:tape measure protein [Acinetobacter sp. SWAC57]|uniref:tape measure protein n=1 Tax=Acinetobacter sp. SWAC57 TaxID=2293834 RepID=UPI000E5B7524|nr:tape measure protein [Acinetobacter sp. SWAC57]RGD93363.1 tape measure domain-containing protein [Acinetobacter sp. SWAC57]